MNLNLEEAVRGYLVVLVSLVNSDVHRVTDSALRRVFVLAKCSRGFRVPKVDDVSRIYVVVEISQICNLSVWNDLPFEKVSRHV